MVNRFCVLTPLSRRQNYKIIYDHLKNHRVDWLPITHQDESELLPSDANPFQIDLNPTKFPCFYKLNKIIDLGSLCDEVQYCYLADDEFFEPGFFDKIPDKDIVIVSMKRGDNVLPNKHGITTLYAKPEEMRVGFVGLEQLVIKGKILKNFRFKDNLIDDCADGELIKELVSKYPITCVPDAYVWFNYLESGRWNK